MLCLVADLRQVCLVSACRTSFVDQDWHRLQSKANMALLHLLKECSRVSSSLTSDHHDAPQRGSQFTTGDRHVLDIWQV